jgi:hypothetical protein
VALTTRLQEVEIEQHCELLPLASFPFSVILTLSQTNNQLGSNDQIVVLLICNSNKDLRWLVRICNHGIMTRCHNMYIPFQVYEPLSFNVSLFHLVPIMHIFHGVLSRLILYHLRLVLHQ